MKLRNDLFLCQTVFVVQDIDAFVNSHQTHGGCWVSSDLQTKHPAGFVRRIRPCWFQLQLQEKGWIFLLHLHYWRDTLSKFCFIPPPPIKWPLCVCNPLKQTHRAHAGVFDVHPYRVGHHFIVICVVIGHDAEGWQHILGDWNDQGNQYLASCSVSAIAHQLTSARDLERNIHVTDMGR